MCFQLHNRFNDIVLKKSWTKVKDINEQNCYTHQIWIRFFFDIIWTEVKKSRKNNIDCHRQLPNYIVVSFMIIYNNTLPFYSNGLVVRWHFDLVNAKQSVLSVCDTTTKGEVQKGEEGLKVWETVQLNTIPQNSLKIRHS